MAPALFTWDGESMVPLKRFAKLCDRDFVVGQVYPLVVHEERSRASHNQFFASVAEAWQNLPEAYEDRFATPDHLRKWALIRAGFRDERSIVVSSKAEARRLAAFIAPMDEFAVIAASQSVVTVYTAKSQSLRAMGKAQFQASKQAVLDVLAGMIGVSADELRKQEAA